MCHDLEEPKDMMPSKISSTQKKRQYNPFICSIVIFTHTGLARWLGEQVKALIAKPEDLSLIPRPHMAEGENQLPHVYTHKYIYKLSVQFCIL